MILLAGSLIKKVDHNQLQEKVKEMSLPIPIVSIIFALLKTQQERANAGAVCRTWRQAMISTIEQFCCERSGESMYGPASIMYFKVTMPRFLVRKQCRLGYSSYYGELKSIDMIPALLVFHKAFAGKYPALFVRFYRDLPFEPVNQDYPFLHECKLQAVGEDEEFVHYELPADQQMPAYRFRYLEWVAFFPEFVPGATQIKLRSIDGNDNDTTADLSCQLFETGQRFVKQPGEITIGSTGHFINSASTIQFLAC